jgi:hypothetical protein
MAVGTSAVDLVPANYVLIGVAPLILQARPGASILVAVATSLPGPTAAGLSLEPGSSPLAITGTGNVYGRALKSATKVVAAILA